MFYCADIKCKVYSLRKQNWNIVLHGLPDFFLPCTSMTVTSVHVCCSRRFILYLAGELRTRAQKELSTFKRRQCRGFEGDRSSQSGSWACLRCHMFPRAPSHPYSEVAGYIFKKLIQNSHFGVLNCVVNWNLCFKLMLVYTFKIYIQISENVDGVIQYIVNSNFTIKNIRVSNIFFFLKTMHFAFCGYVGDLKGCFGALYT